MRPTDSIKPRELWDQQDRLDYLDGWHEACGLDFRSKRDPQRRVVFVDPTAKPPEFEAEPRHELADHQRGALVEQWLEEHTLHHPTAALMAAGRTARQRHRSSVGL